VVSVRNPTSVVFTQEAGGVKGVVRATAVLLKGSKVAREAIALGNLSSARFGGVKRLTKVVRFDVCQLVLS
jgi:hypothetical protein